MWFGRVVLLLGWAQLWDGVFFFGSPLVVYVLLAIAQGVILATYIGAWLALSFYYDTDHDCNSFRIDYLQQVEAA